MYKNSFQKLALHCDTICSLTILTDVIIHLLKIACMFSIINEAEICMSGTMGTAKFRITAICKSLHNL